MASRLRAMSAGEAARRMAERGIRLAEAARWRLRPRPVDVPLYRAARRITFDPAPLGLVTDGRNAIDTGHSIRIPGGYDYREYSTDWHAGFQTPAQWPRTWAYSLAIRGRDDIGDARTNWELNRLGQFTLMAKAFYLTGDVAHLERLRVEMDSWTARNPFLHGIAWVSPMETALRCINWLYAAAFLHESDPAGHGDVADALVHRLVTGAANMAAYLRRHSARGSSAGCALLVEQAALVLAGSCLGRRRWVGKACRILSRELPRQFTPDGVHRESGLRYHAFAAEAYLVAAHCLTASGAGLPPGWKVALERMAGFVTRSRVAPGVYVAWGDDDEGHILRLTGRDDDYYAYICQFASLVTGHRIGPMEPLSPTLEWLFTPGRIDAVSASAEGAVAAEGSHTYADGGYSLLRRGGITAGVDHAPAGIGATAAHAHADALSVQLYAGDRPLLIDPGTYLYDVARPGRDRLCSAAMHNTVVTGGAGKDEIPGPGMWGRHSDTRLIDHGEHHVEATAKGLSGVEHRRRVYLADDHTVEITDSFSRECDWTATFVTAPGMRPSAASRGTVKLGAGATLTYTDSKARVEPVEVSPAYGVKTAASAVRISGHGTRVQFTININPTIITSKL